jgi:hypothetical protein
VNNYTLIKQDGTREKVPFLMVKKTISEIIPHDYAYISKNVEKEIPYVSPHISKAEIDDNWTGEVVIFEPVIQCFEEARKLLGKSIGINSGYRSQDYQQHLKELGYKTATNSPHCLGAALDLAIPYGTTYLSLVSLLKQAARSLGLPKPRFGYKEYGYTFLHFDLVFMLFEPYTAIKNPNPDAWRAGIEW